MNASKSESRQNATARFVLSVTCSCGVGTVLGMDGGHRGARLKMAPCSGHLHAIARYAVMTSDRPHICR